MVRHHLPDRYWLGMDGCKHEMLRGFGFDLYPQIDQRRYHWQQRNLRTSLLKVEGEIRYTTEDATQTDLEGEQFHNGRVVAKIDDSIKQNPGYAQSISTNSKIGP